MNKAFLPLHIRKLTDDIDFWYAKKKKTYLLFFIRNNYCVQMGSCVLSDKGDRLFRGRDFSSILEFCHWVDGHNAFFNTCIVLSDNKILEKTDYSILMNLIDYSITKIDIKQLKHIVKQFFTIDKKCVMKCVDNYTMEDYFNVGELYEVLDIEGDLVKVLDRYGRIQLVLRDRFMEEV